jgi:hypothetical protein
LLLGEMKTVVDGDQVNPSKILENVQVLELFTYLGMTNSGNKGQSRV